jgi:hypothetical protein
MTDAPAPCVWTEGLRWLEREREGFALPRGEEPELFRLKALGELAAISEVIWRRRGLPPDLRARVRALLEFAWRELEEGEVLARSLDARPYPVLGTTYSVFERMGWRHEGVRRRLADLGQPGALARIRASAPAASVEPVTAQYGTDGVAVLCLGLALAWEVLGLPSPWQRARLYPGTCLARRPEVEELTVPEGYSLTHAVFFMTDWGAEPQGLPEAERAYLEARCPRWMEAFRGRGHFDLYAELAAVLCCAGVNAPAEAEAVLARAQQDDGSVPGPAERVAERTRGIEDPDRRRFVGAYHTTLASTLASFALRHGLERTALRASPGS